MATPIRDCPTLTGKVAEDFIKKAKEAEKRRGTIELKMTYKDYKAILKTKRN
ncbi:hypothetical protein EZS27_017682 [termite gut metagenome]|jgi:hypothetical protein|uniref:Uncharacterized protein n=1 Tax=termite gut metagenome TaxID=433724 RepID=A0A5J4RM76_9ZZZZ